MVLDDLRWLGLEWDEGPDIGGEFGPYRQSERRPVYRAAADELIERGVAYPCFCPEELLERKRGEAEAAGRPPHYDLTCWRVEPAERLTRVRQGREPYAIRFHVPKEPDAKFDADVTIDDLIRGEVTWKGGTLGDFIVVRSDGMPTYNFSVVVDDHAMEISHVIRAEEHLTNTHRQVLIYRALDWKIPAFAHVSLILGEDRSKLSKRHGATSVAQFAQEGYFADAMVNYLALLGWSPPEGAEIFSREEAIAHFGLERVNPAPAVFDPQKLLWVNAQYVRKTESSLLRRQVSRALEEEGWVTGGGPEAEGWLNDAIDVIKSGLERTTDVIPALRFLFEFDPRRAIAEPEIAGLVRDPQAIAVMEALAEDLKTHGGPVTVDAYHEMTERLKAATGRKGKALFMPIRVAVTGMMHGPELARSIPLLETGSRTRGIAGVMAPTERVEVFLAAIR